MDERDIKRMVQLAREGKIISKIWEEDFPQYDYWDVYLEVNSAGERSAQGTKRMISNRLKKMTNASQAEQEALIDEVSGLVYHLYSRYKEGQLKLEKVRRAVE